MLWVTRSLVGRGFRRGKKWEKYFLGRSQLVCCPQPSSHFFFFHAMINNTPREPTNFRNVFQVKLVAKNGRFPGMRGATCRLATRHHGYQLRDGSGGVTVGDTDESCKNIFVDLYFLEVREMKDFIQGVARKSVISEHNPEISYETNEATVDVLAQLEDVTESEFSKCTPPGSIALSHFDRAVQHLASFSASSSKKRSASSSATPPRNPSSRTSDSSGLSVVSETSPLFQWQSLENPSSHGTIPYRCHLVDSCLKPPENPNNYLAESWEFHQRLDGLHLPISPHRVPTLVVEFVRRGMETELATDGIRHKVFVKIRFRDDACIADFKRYLEYRLKEGSVWEESSKTYQSFVHVLDVNKFRGFLNLKKALTTTRWQEYSESRVPLL